MSFGEGSDLFHMLVCTLYPSGLVRGLEMSLDGGMELSPSGEVSSAGPQTARTESSQEPRAEKSEPLKGVTVEGSI